MGFALARSDGARGGGEDVARLDRSGGVSNQRAGHFGGVVLVRADNRRHVQLFGAADGIAARDVRHLARDIPAAGALRTGWPKEIRRIPSYVGEGFELSGVREFDR